MHRSMFDELGEIVKESATKPVLVRFNTVKLAQIFYAAARAAAPRQKIMVIHSNFMEMHRRGIEQAIEHLVPAGKPCMVISTSIADRVMDLDFHRVWTECCPIPVLLQVAGRLNRFGDRTPFESILTVVSQVNDRMQIESQGQPLYRPFEHNEISVTRALLPGCRTDVSLTLLNEQYWREVCPDISESPDYLRGKEHLKQVLFRGKSNSEDTTTAGLLAFPFGSRASPASGWYADRIQVISSSKEYTMRDGHDTMTTYLLSSQRDIQRALKDADEESLWELLHPFKTQVQKRFLPIIAEANKRLNLDLFRYMQVNGFSIRMIDFPYSPDAGIDIAATEAWTADLKRQLQGNRR